MRNDPKALLDRYRRDLEDKPPLPAKDGYYLQTRLLEAHWE